MLNCEKWKDTLKELERNGFPIALDLKGVPCSCHDITCEKCLFCDNSTTLQKCNSTNLYDWLCEEYKEPEIDWNKDIDWFRVPVDTKVLVRNLKESLPHERKFAVYVPGSCAPYRTFNVGEKQKDSTSLVAWKYCKLANEDDVEKYRKRESK